MKKNLIYYTIYLIAYIGLAVKKKLLTVSALAKELIVVLEPLNLFHS